MPLHIVSHLEEPQTVENEPNQHSLIRGYNLLTVCVYVYGFILNASLGSIQNDYGMEEIDN